MHSVTFPRNVPMSLTMKETTIVIKKVIRIPVSFNSFGIISICVISWYPLLPRTSIRVYLEEAVVVSFFLKLAFLHMT